MKTFILVLSLFCLVGCGANYQGDIDQPIVTPIAVDGSKTVRYNVPNGFPKSCRADILINGNYVSASTYSVDCDYNSSNQITAFLITFYVSVPTVATLRYNLY